MGIYADSNLLDWFVSAYKESTTTKLDMGKSCVRFNPKKEIPFDVIKGLCSKLTAQDWVSLYESTYRK